MHASDRKGDTEGCEIAVALVRSGGTLANRAPVADNLPTPANLLNIFFLLTDDGCW
jgi:hypothetical protein